MSKVPPDSSDTNTVYPISFLKNDIDIVHIVLISFFKTISISFISFRYRFQNDIDIVHIVSISFISFLSEQKTTMVSRIFSRSCDVREVQGYFQERTHLSITTWAIRVQPFTIGKYSSLVFLCRMNASPFPFFLWTIWMYLPFVFMKHMSAYSFLHWTVQATASKE